MQSLLSLSFIMASTALTPKPRLRLPVTTTKVATLTPLREEQILTPRELVKPAARRATRAVPSGHVRPFS